jgi:hypothetical protein
MIFITIIYKYPSHDPGESKKITATSVSISIQHNPLPKGLCGERTVTVM